MTIYRIRAPQFHVFPKVHKPKIPGRYAVSSVESHASKVSKFLHHFFHQHAKSLPSYVKDTSDFINQINETKDINKDIILVTLYV